MPILLLGRTEPPGSRTPTGRRRWSQRLPIALIALLAVAFALVAWSMRFLVDDSLINFRFSANLAAGYGPVFNAGERVEGYTTPLWILVIGLFARLGASLPDSAHAIGVACGVASTVVAARFVARRSGWWYGGLAALLVAACPGMLFWAASGMETAPFALTVLLAFVATAEASAPRTCGLLAGVMALTRPEGMLLAALLDLATFFEYGAGAAVRFGVGFLILFLPAEMFRLAYFGYPLPNTYYLKADVHGVHGLWYLRQFLADGGWVYALGVVALAGRERRTAAVWLLSATAYLGYVALVGGDFFAFHRFVVPIVPLLAVLAALGAKALARADVRVNAALALGLCGLWLASLVPSYDYMERAARQTDAFSQQLENRGQVLKHLPPGTVLATSAIGGVPFAAGIALTVIDMLGKTDEHIAHHGLHVPDGLPAHSRYDNDYLLARRPGLILLGCTDGSPARPLTAAVVRDEPCRVQALGELGLETGRYRQHCPRPAADEPQLCLPNELDLLFGSHRAAFEAAYEPVVSLPGVGHIPNLFGRRDRPLPNTEPPLPVPRSP